MTFERTRLADVAPGAVILALALQLAACATGAVTTPSPPTRPSLQITDCGELDVRYSEQAKPATPGTIVPSSFIIVPEEEVAAKERETRSRFACFMRALAECRPARLTVVDGKRQVTRTVAPLKDGSCAMRLESIEPRKMGPSTSAPFQDYKTYSAIPAVRLCTFVTLNVWNNRVECRDEVVESERGNEFHPVSTEDCPFRIESNARPTPREKACIVNAVLSCSSLKAHFRVPKNAYGGPSEMRLSISQRLDRHGDRTCGVDLENVISYGGHPRTTSCRDVDHLDIALSNSWDEGHLLLLSSAPTCVEIRREIW